MGRFLDLASLTGYRCFRPYAAAVLIVGAVTAAGALVLNRVTPTNLVMLYLLAVVVVGLRWGLGAAVLSSILGVLAFDFFFVPPHFSFAVSDAEYLITFGAFLMVALVVGTLTGRLRDHAAVLRLREQETAALYAFSRSMVAVQSVTETGKAVVNHVSESFNRPVALLLREEGRPGLHTVNFGITLDETERAAALWTLQHGEAAGLGEDAWPDARACCIPLRTVHGVFGALAVRQPNAESQLAPGQRRLLEALTAQAAVVVERAQLAEAARRAQLVLEAEKLQDALLHSISHALRTPLASIIGSLSALTDPSQVQLDQATRNDLVETAREEAERLNWLVSNLLDMTRLESGHLKLTVDWHDIEDVVGAALGQAGDSLKGRPVQVRIQGELPLVPLDQVLIIQVLDNLLNNAVKYSPPGSPIDIQVRKVEGAVEVQVADRGIGIPPEYTERIFEKFFRVERSGNPSGTGLGLAICKGIVEAHRGRIWANARAGGGTEISFTLPLLTHDVEAGGYE